MLILTEALRHEVLAHVYETSPVEACGILAGPAFTETPTRLIRMRNLLHSAVAYQFDPVEQIAAYQEMDTRGEDPIALYHSHTATAALPSRVDTRLAADLDTRYLIVSTADRDAPVLRAWAPRRAFPAEAELPESWDERAVAAWWSEIPVRVLSAHPKTVNQPATALDA